MRASAMTATPPTSVLDIGRSELTLILEQVIAQSNAGSVIRLSLTCKRLRQLVISADGLWQMQCAQLGWRPQGDDDLSMQRPREDEAWCYYFSRRMQARVRVRALLRSYAGFLPRPASMALGTGGATVQQLAAAEQQLDFTLPWEMWELYRYRNGQAPGASVVLVDDCRWLMLGECAVVTREVPTAGCLAPEGSSRGASEGHLPALVARQLAVAAGTPPGGRASGGGGGGQQQACEPGGAAAGQQQVLLLVFAANAMQSRAYAVDAAGRVYVERGLYTLRRVAGSVAAWLAGLLV